MSSSINARSLTKFMPDRDEDSAVANLKDNWQPPSSALPEVRQYRTQLVQHVTALSFGVGVGASTYTERSLFQQIERAARLMYITTAVPTDSGSVFFLWKN
jgi:hypothetical protein